jgi:hypothetical protein
MPTADFSGTDGLDVLLVKAYQGEVLGETMFGNLAVRLSNPDHAAKMGVLETLEQRTKEAMVPAMVRAGLPTEHDQAAVHEGVALADAVLDLPWADLMGSIEQVTTEFLTLYRRIGEVNSDEQEISALLVAHEEALRDFARQELVGNVGGSLHQIRALPHLH